MSRNLWELRERQPALQAVLLPTDKPKGMRHDILATGIPNSWGSDTHDDEWLVARELAAVIALALGGGMPHPSEDAGHWVRVVVTGMNKLPVGDTGMASAVLWAAMWIVSASHRPLGIEPEVWVSGRPARFEVYVKIKAARV